MKYLIGDIPYEWLEEEEEGKGEDISYLEITMLVYQDDIRRTEKYDGTTGKYQFLELVFVPPWGDEETTRKHKQCGGYHPENWWEDDKNDIAYECRQCEYHSWEKYGVFLLGRVDPEPETKEHKEVE